MKKIVFLYIFLMPCVSFAADRNIFFKQMKSLEQDGNLAGAISIGEKYLEEHRWDGKIYYKLARDYYNSGQKQKSSDLLHELIKRDPKNPWLPYCAEILNWLGVDYIRSYQLDKSEKYLAEALTYNKKKHYIFRNLARVLELTGRLQEARDLYIKSGELGSPYYSRDIKRVREKISKRVEPPPQPEPPPKVEKRPPAPRPEPVPKVEKKEMPPKVTETPKLFEHGNFKVPRRSSVSEQLKYARDSFNNSNDQDGILAALMALPYYYPDDTIAYSEAYLMTASVYDRVNQTEKSLTYLDKIIQLNPSRALTGAALLQSAKYMKKIKKLREAIKYYDTFINNFPERKNDIAWSLLDMARIHRTLKNDDEAAVILKRLISDYTSEKEPHFWGKYALGNLYLSQKNYSKARQIFIEIKAMPDCPVYFQEELQIKIQQTLNSE